MYAPIDHEFLIQEFRDEIDQHGPGLDEIIIDQGLGGGGGAGKRVFPGQGGGPPGAQGREHQIEQADQQHGFFQVRVRTEGVFPVKGKVPQHGQDQAHQIRQPRRPVEDLVEQRIGNDLDDPGADGEKGKFQRLKGLVLSGGFFFGFVHGVCILSVIR